VKSHLTRVYLKTGSRNRVQAARYYLNHYTAAHGSDAATESRSSERAGQLSVIEHQVRQIQARLEQLAPAAAETERLRQALDALRDLETK
jgi:hypothetical protein